MNFLMRHLFSAALFSCLCTVSTHSLAVDVKSGTWEWTTTVEILGTSISVPAALYQSCISTSNLVPRSASSTNCKVTSHTINADRVDWTMKCTRHKKTSTHTGYMIYNDTAAMGASQSQSGDSAISTTILGSYIGPCN